MPIPHCQYNIMTGSAYGRHAAIAALAVLGVACRCAAFDASLSELREEAASIQPWLLELRRELHQSPELMYQEFNTSAFIRHQLDELGISYRYGAFANGTANNF